MAQTTQARTKTKAEQEAQQKALRRAEQANILAGVRPILEPEEQLLAFARTRIAGGWRGKLNVGPEAFFAPFANVALTERRFIVQHVHHSSGRPSEMLPHSYALGAIARATFTDIETFGGEPACRLVLHLQNGLYVRLRLRGQLNFASAQSMVELFDSLTLAQRSVPVSPLQTACAHCGQILDKDYKFCPYCGTAQGSASGITLATEEEGTNAANGEASSPLNPDVNSQSAVYVPQETDFAYERADLPAEFGTALPLPEQVQPEVEEVTAVAPVDNAAPPETGLTTTGILADESVLSEPQGMQPEAPEEMLDAVAPENFADVSLFAPGSDSAPTPGKPQSAHEETSAADETEGKRQTLEPDDLTTSEYPLAADFDTAEGVPTTATAAESAASAEFGQYDSQDFTELPFSQSSDGEVSETQNQNVADSASDVIREDGNEALSPSQPHETHEDNATTASSPPTDAQPPAASHPSPTTENQP